ncbi:MAG: cation-transporting P-type ATPase [Methanoregula sp.]
MGEKGNELREGLIRQEVGSLREKYGFNDTRKEKKHPFLRFLGYFWGPTPASLLRREDQEGCEPGSKTAKAVLISGPVPRFPLWERMR